jgi:hypothetical protein
LAHLRSWSRWRLSHRRGFARLGPRLERLTRLIARLHGRLSGSLHGRRLNNTRLRPFKSLVTRSLRRESPRLEPISRRRFLTLRLLRLRRRR